MSKGTINKAILIGRLGADPEIRYTPSGTPVANFNIATNRSWKDKDGNANEETTWHRIVMWSRQAEVANEYLKKGSQVYVEGRIQTREYEDQNGQKRFITEIVASNFQMLDSRGGSTTQSSGNTSSDTDSQDMSPPENMDVAPDDVPF